MTVLRIVRNVKTDDPEAAVAFYRDILGLDTVMDMGWIRTLASESRSAPQISFAEQGGSDTPVPDISVEVDNFEEVVERLEAHAARIEYGPVVEPWGVRRIFVRDPFGQLVNILAHS